MPSSAVSAVEHLGHHLVDEFLDPSGHPLPYGGRLGKELVLEGQIEVLVVALLPSLAFGIGDHLGPDLFAHAFAPDLGEIAALHPSERYRSRLLRPPTKPSGERSPRWPWWLRSFARFTEPFRAVARGAVLGAADLIRGQGIVDLRGKLHLDTRIGLPRCRGWCRC